MEISQHRLGRSALLGFGLFVVVYTVLSVLNQRSSAEAKFRKGQLVDQYVVATMVSHALATVPDVASLLPSLQKEIDPKLCEFSSTRSAAESFVRITIYTEASAPMQAWVEPFPQPDSTDASPTRPILLSSEAVVHTAQESTPTINFVRSEPGHPISPPNTPPALTLYWRRKP